MRPRSALQQIQEVFHFQQTHLASMLKKAGSAIKQRDREIAELRGNVQQLQCQVGRARAPRASLGDESDSRRCTTTGRGSVRSRRAPALRRANSAASRAPSAIHPRFRAATRLRRMLAVSRSAPRRRNAMRPSRLHRHASPPGCRLHLPRSCVVRTARAAAAASVTLRRRGARISCAARRWLNAQRRCPIRGRRCPQSATRPCRRPVVALPRPA